MKFLHTADWQLGKPYGRFDPDVRAALSEARFDAINLLGEQALAHGIGHILVAGDIFDTEGPEDRTIVQATSRMGQYDVNWWLLPGNHDFARNGGLWDRVRRHAGPKIHILSEARPHEMTSGVWLLPAPLVHRHSHDDPTDLYDSMETPGARLRIGLAHGSIQDFGNQGETKNQIAPDRARRSELDYLALGDWHGVLQVDGRTWYSGTPETDRFRRDEPGHALIVELAPGQSPQVTAIRTGRYTWLQRTWRINDAAEFQAEVARLQAQIDPSATLLQLNLQGITALGDRIQVLNLLETDLVHRLRYLDAKTEELVGRPTPADLETLAVEGMLGAAAAKLSALIEAGGPEAPVAMRALERLFVEYSRETRA